MGEARGDRGPARRARRRGRRCPPDLGSSAAARRRTSSARTASGSGGIAIRARRAPDEVEHRQSRDHPDGRIEAVRDGLRRIRRHRQRAPLDSGRQGPLQQGSPDPPELAAGPDEEHRQVPDRSTLHRRREGDHLRCARPGAVGPASPGAVATQKRSGSVASAWAWSRRSACVVGRDLLLAERQQVVVQALAPDVLAGRQVGCRGRPERDPVGQGHAGSSSPSSPDGGLPVARRSSSACMKESRSPSRTALVFDVS